MNLELNLTKRIAISLGLGLALARIAHADPAVTTHKALTLDGARGLITAAQKVARARHTTGAIAVVDEGDNLIALDLGTIRFSEQPANLAWGDADRRTLYVTARTGLYRVRVNVPGAGVSP